MVAIRIAEEEDAAGILAIYSPHILHSATTFELEIPSLADFRLRMKHYQAKYPWLVCVINDQIAGYVYASTYKDREAYQWSCECSVYIDSKFQGQGIAKELYTVLFPILKLQGFCNVFAGITIPNNASIKLHEAFGFSPVAIYENVGYKLGGWKSVGWWRLQINEYYPEPSPPLVFSDLDSSMFQNYLDAAASNINNKILNN